MDVMNMIFRTVCSLHLYSDSLPALVLQSANYCLHKKTSLILVSSNVWKWRPHHFILIKMPFELKKWYAGCDSDNHQNINSAHTVGSQMGPNKFPFVVLSSALNAPCSSNSLWSQVPSPSNLWYLPYNIYHVILSAFSHDSIKVLMF